MQQINTITDMLIDFARDAQNMTNSDMQGVASVLAKDIMHLCAQSALCEAGECTAPCTCNK